MLVRKFSFILVCFYFKIINTLCEESVQLAFVVDDTRGLWNHIGVSFVDRLYHAVVQSVVPNYALLVIDAEDVVFRTKHNSSSLFEDVFAQHLEYKRNMSIKEMSLTGVETAILATEPGSHIYVFTDVTAKRDHKVDSIKCLCQQKQTQVDFVLVRVRYEYKDFDPQVYRDISDACSGQVYDVKDNEVFWVMQTIKQMLKGSYSVLERSHVRTSGGVFDIFSFTVDEKVDEVIIAIAGEDVQYRITTPNYHHYLYDHAPTETIASLDTVKVVKVIDRTPGRYEAWVSSGGEWGKTSIVIYARTDYKFDHGFSVVEPTSMKDTSKQPLSGQEQYLSIHTTDPKHSVDCKSVRLVTNRYIGKNEDMAIWDHRELPLRKNGDNFYITDPFLPPYLKFQIELHGVIRNTSQPITRISKVAVELQTLPSGIPAGVAPGSKESDV